MDNDVADQSTVSASSDDLILKSDELVFLLLLLEVSLVQIEELAVPKLLLQLLLSLVYHLLLLVSEGYLVDLVLDPLFVLDGQMHCIHVFLDEVAPEVAHLVLLLFEVLIVDDELLRLVLVVDDVLNLFSDASFVN